MAIPQIIFNVTLGELSEVPGTPYAYWAPKSLRELFHKYPPLDRDVANQPDKPKIADVKVGLQTSDDLRFTRYWWEVAVDQIAISREETLQGKKWVPFAIGSWLDRFFYDYQVTVNWRNNGDEIRNYRDKDGKLISRPQNIKFFFREGACWMTSPQAGSIMKGTLKNLNIRRLPKGCIFSAAMCAVLPQSIDNWSLIGILNSSLLWAGVRLRGEGKFQVGYIASLPISGKKTGNISRFAREAHDNLRDWSGGNETATLFIAPWILQIFWRLQGKTDAELLTKTKHPLSRDFQWSDWESAKKIKEVVIGAEKPTNVSLWNLAQRCVKWETLLRQRVDEIQRQIDDEVYNLYGISEEDRALIEAELSKPLEEEIQEEGEESEENGVAEEERSPEGILSAEEHIRRLVHYVAHEVIKSDSEGIIPLADTYTLDGRLKRGLIYLVREKFKEIFGGSAMVTLEEELREVFGAPLESWLASEFFNYHVSLFRLRPIIWQITSRPRGESQFNCFIYWHKLDKDTLRKVQEVYLRPALDNARIEAERQAGKFTEKRATGASFKILREVEKTWRKAQERYEELRTLSERIKNLLQPHKLQVQSRSAWIQEKVNEIVAQGYRPDWDYGVRVNIEPLKQAGILPPGANRVKG